MDETERKKRWEAEAALRRFEPVSDHEVLAGSSALNAIESLRATTSRVCRGG